MNVAEVAQTLSRSKGGVSMRRRLLDEMSPAIREILFRGAFPVYSYMYTLRPFMRMNTPRRQEIERFVQAVAGQRWSVRDIELLAQGYFRGPASLREAIEGGKLNWSLDQWKHVPEDREGCNGFPGRRTARAQSVGPRLFDLRRIRIAQGYQVVAGTEHWLR